MSRAREKASIKLVDQVHQLGLTNAQTFMKKSNSIFSEIYTLDPVTNCYIIEIGLDQYADIFDEWDPAPFKRRSLDPDLELYLKGSSEEIPLRHPIELMFLMPAGSRNEALEQAARHGIRNSIAFKMYLLRKELKKTQFRLVRYVLLGFVFLWAGQIFPDRFGETMLTSLLAEGIFIGGWVFLWEAVSLFFFTDLELYERYRAYKRLLNAPVFFREVSSQSLAEINRQSESDIEIA